MEKRNGMATKYEYYTEQFHATEYYCSLTPRNMPSKLITVLLLARYHIWLAKTNKTLPHFEHYLLLLKSRYELETKGGDRKKWEPLAEYIEF